MKQSLYLLPAIFAAILFFFSHEAKSDTSFAMFGCEMREYNNVSVQFETEEEGLDKSVEIYKTKIENINSQLTKAGITDFVISNYNYNIYSNNGHKVSSKKRDYRITGSLTLKTENMDTALKIAKYFDNKEDFTANLSGSGSLKNGNCKKK